MKIEWELVRFGLRQEESRKSLKVEIYRRNYLGLSTIKATTRTQDVNWYIKKSYIKLFGSGPRRLIYFRFTEGGVNKNMEFSSVHYIPE